MHVLNQPRVFPTAWTGLFKIMLLVLASCSMLYPTPDYLSSVLRGMPLLTRHQLRAMDSRDTLRTVVPPAPVRV